MTDRKPDFAGYATKAGLKCSDGRTILPGAFAHQNATRVPLVWQHGHTDPENVLGHALLENRADGVYAYGFFNKTNKAEHSHELLEHGDINSLSIWANQLRETNQIVSHGQIREVSLVLAGANPGATIESVTIRHGDQEYEAEDEGIIHTGLDLEVFDDSDFEDGEFEHAAGDGEETIEDVYNSMTPPQKDVLHYMIGEALAGAGKKNPPAAAEHSALNNEEGNTMIHNVFESGTQANKAKESVLSHSELTKLIKTAKGAGHSLKDTVQRYLATEKKVEVEFSLEHSALSHGIGDIEVLFPDAKTITETPEWVKRNTSWVPTLLAACRKSPFSKIKTLSADITADEARAKGYITGNFKKEEFFAIKGRTTGPTTIYKKQSLDRDDMVDITDFDVVIWLKAEMRMMLDEELARALLVGDGREVGTEDKIDENCIRPVAKDHEMYTSQVNVNVSDSNSSMLEVTDAFLANRWKFKGTGVPTLYMSETWISRFLMERDADKRRMWKTLDELASELRVSKIEPVEILEEYPTIIAIMFNPVDYVLGATRGGEVNFFDDFDIDYNKQKYLIETRVSGCLVKLKAAMVFNSVPATSVEVIPQEPAFNPATGVVTIPSQTGVVYKNGAGTTLTAGAQSAIAAGATTTVKAVPATNYHFPNSDVDDFTFKRNA